MSCGPSPVSGVRRGGGSEDTFYWGLLTFVLQTLRTLVQIARDPVIFKGQRHCDETEIEDEHGHSQDLAHLPARHQDREENKKKHGK